MPVFTGLPSTGAVQRGEYDSFSMTHVGFVASIRPVKRASGSDALLRTTLPGGPAYGVVRLDDGACVALPLNATSGSRRCARAGDVRYGTITSAMFSLFAAIGSVVLP